MKIQNDSNEYESYTREQHIENIKRLARLRSQADGLGTGTGGIDQMMSAATEAALKCGLSEEEIDLAKANN